jgi:gamma-glutamyl hercynylcysteine S-oxide synthase
VDVSAENEDPLLREGFVYEMLLAHELQHEETMLQLLQLVDGYEPALPLGTSPLETGGPEQVLVAAGSYEIGAPPRGFAYDNERPRHAVDLEPFRIDHSPVSNRAYLEFVEAGGYADESLWAPDGWTYVQRAGLAHPGGWLPQGDGAYALRRFGHELELPLDEPVQHVCWYEADAFARWAGRRLPTEFEWEAAAARLQHVRRVWEWTASPFAGYPGFRAFPYEEYSQDFYTGEYRVLRGGCWATDPLVARLTFRNWDYPIRRQIFAGLRTAADG